MLAKPAPIYRNYLWDVPPDPGAAVFNLDGSPYEAANAIPSIDSYISEASKAPLITPSAPGDKMPTDQELFDAKIRTAGAETDTKIARLEGKLDLVLTKLDDVKEDGRHTRNNALLIGVSLAILIIGIVAAAPAIFDLGFKNRETISKEVQEQLSKVPPVTPQK